MSRHLFGSVALSLGFALGLGFASRSIAHGADDPPADVTTKVTSDAKAVGTAVKHDAKVVAEAAKEGAQQVAEAAKEVAHDVAAAGKQGAQEVAAAAKQSAEKAKAAVKPDTVQKTDKAAGNTNNKPAP
jgi:general stress protein YciG